MMTHPDETPHEPLCNIPDIAQTVAWSSRPPGESWNSVVQSWPWRELRTAGDELMGWLKQGDCPRCCHQMSVRQHVGFFFADQPLLARCDCDGAHDGRPVWAEDGC